MIGYFFIGIKLMMKSSVLTFAIYFISFLLLLILWRRYVIVRQSGGNFFAPFHIAKGRFYIHNAYVFRKRIIPLNNIKKIEVHFIPSVKLNGARYFLTIEQKSGKALAFFFSKSKENDQLVNNLKNETKKYNIKIRILES
ncbi:hypothetical protein [Streptococcus sp. 21WXBC0057M1]|uniref:DUF304 domain-containing protein n=1 Tax=Streptococcus wuxiensis TaxID=3095078 RepID=A0ABU5FS73_9STRE|nr:hypothetical protein [Streptococcus sp. 21WXBC0057M1]MDY4336937.1 hypothetical protein [Streptococcus sp. 21WXBC0057M1]